jgi:hypothetical protein
MRAVKWIILSLPQQNLGTILMAPSQESQKCLLSWCRYDWRHEIESSARAVGPIRNWKRMRDMLWIQSPRGADVGWSVTRLRVGRPEDWRWVPVRDRNISLRHYIHTASYPTGSSFREAKWPEPTATSFKQWRSRKEDDVHPLLCMSACFGSQ